MDSSPPAGSSGLGVSKDDGGGGGGGGDGGGGGGGATAPSSSSSTRTKVPIPRLRRGSKSREDSFSGSVIGSLADGKHRVSHACEPCRQRKTKVSNIWAVAFPCRIHASYQYNYTIYTHGSI